MYGVAKRGNPGDFYGECGRAFGLRSATGSLGLTSGDGSLESSPVSPGCYLSIYLSIVGGLHTYASNFCVCGAPPRFGRFALLSANLFISLLCSIISKVRCARRTPALRTRWLGSLRSGPVRFRANSVQVALRTPPRIHALLRWHDYTMQVQ